MMLTFSCSTKRKGFIFRNYHALTARDNGYFNAKLKVIETEITLSEAHIDKYDRILSVFKYADDEQAKMIFSPMDDAIKKISISIEKHSITLKGVEYNVWIDDCYLLMGEAQFYKHDFATALETFQYVASQYKNSPHHYDAVLWMLQCNMELKKDEAAETLIDFIKNDPKFPKKLLGRYSAIVADYHVRKKNYSLSAKNLTKAIALTHKKPSKTRYTFILAQLYQKMHDYPRAFRLYGKVIKANPSYDMEFNARMNRAICFDAIGSDTKAIKKELLKMLKEEKNKDYFDQINYALAEITLKEGDVPGAIEYLRSSVRTSTNNTNQKAISYLELADIFFKKPDYVGSQAYYDSTVSILTKDHPDYYSILNKRNSLDKLVKQLKIIAFEDSVQKIAGMNPSQRDKFIADLMASELRAAQKKKEEEAAAKIQNNTLAPQNQNQKSSFGDIGASQWYFYNSSAISFGHTEFVKKWGQIKLEDNWRKSRKDSEQSLAAEDEEGSSSDSSSVLSKNQDKGKKDKSFYVKNLPLTEKAIEESNNRITEAYYTLGLIYKEQLFDNDEAVKAFEELIRRFPDNKYLPQCYYQLYRIFLAAKNTERADYYKNLLFKNFSESDYTRLIKDPAYAESIKSNASKVNAYYEETYRQYLQKNFQVVLGRAHASDSLFPLNELKAKFAYLGCLSTGKTASLDDFQRSLIKFIKQFPDDPIKKAAQENVDMILAKKLGRNPADNVLQFKQNADTVHYYMMVVGSNFDSNKLKIGISNFDSQFYSEQELLISGMVLDANNQLVMVKEFTNSKMAMDYLKAVSKSEAVMGLKSNEFQHFVISSPNFFVLFNLKKIPDYIEFFDSNYQ